MRILAIGDVHQESVALTRALDRFTHTVDRVVCVGDLVDGAVGLAAARQCLRTLRERGVATVAGNHDRWWLSGRSRDDAEAIATGSLADEIEWVATLPRTFTFPTNLGTAMVAHGLVTDDLAAVDLDSMEYEVTAHGAWEHLRSHRIALHIGGHTHREHVRWIGDPDSRSPYAGCLFVNAGTLHRGHGPCACVIDTEARTVAWFPYDGERFGAPKVAEF